METIEQNQQVAILEKSLDVLKSGPEILIANQARKDKAIAVGRNILQAIQERGMNQDLDERSMKYLVNVNTANKEMKESRSSVTQIMDQLKKMYTEVENDLDVKKAGTIPAQIQDHRDLYAKQLAEEAERKRKGAERIAAKQKEAIEIKYQMESSFSDQYNNILLTKKQKFIGAFNAINLDNFEAKADGLKKATFELYDKAIDDLKYNLSSSLHTSLNEAIEIQKQVLADKMPDAKNNFIAEMNLLKDDLIDKLPSKLAELQEQKRIADEAAAEAEKARLAEQKRQEEIAKANIAKRKQLEAQAAIERQKEQERQDELRKKQEEAAAEQKRREQEEADKIKAEAEEQKRKAEQESEIKKQGEQTMVLFEQEAMIAETSPAPEVRQGYEIEVLHQVGYTQLFALWFENEGKNWPLDKLEKLLGPVKNWCEKKAHKDGVKIESKFLKYHESFKAINRKVK